MQLSGERFDLTGSMLPGLAGKIHKVRRGDGLQQFPRRFQSNLLRQKLVQFQERLWGGQNGSVFVIQADDTVGFRFCRQC